ncbi:hypothetical protein FACS189449_07390 [Alphaproteobacteria bacterium]|nr:hypothetical protein FACS189449_07390 [Alphaproteobacteria bacterium]
MAISIIVVFGILSAVGITVALAMRPEAVAEVADISVIWRILKQSKTEDPAPLAPLRCR